MGFADTYFRRFRVSPLMSVQLPPINADVVVVIPACNEPLLLNTLDCFLRQRNANCKTLVLIVVNHSVDAPDQVKKQNQQTYNDVLQFAENHSGPDMHFTACMLADVPHKTSGVGLARKSGMDDALRIFDYWGRNDGLLVSLDADCDIDENYLKSIVGFFDSHPRIKAATLYFEHPVSGEEFSPEIYEAAAAYELHVRYFRLGLAYAGYPHPLHTVGSCFALRASAYAAAGGMNTRQGGEDFYFLHKLTAFTEIPCIAGTCVHPSPRISDRVPFGTGPAVKLAVEKGMQTTYHPQLFAIMKGFFACFPQWHTATPDEVLSGIAGLDEHLIAYCKKITFLEIVENCQRNTSTREAFLKRMFRSFDAFRLIRFLNEAPEYRFPRVPVTEAASALLKEAGCQSVQADMPELLELFRRIDRPL